jgi:hypothetical protein
MTGLIFVCLIAAVGTIVPGALSKRKLIVSGKLSGMRILSVCYVVYISATRWPIFCCPPEKESNSKWPKKVALKMSNFGTHFWPWVTLVTLLKYANGGYLS